MILNKGSPFVIIIICLIFVNLYSFFLFWRDKRLALNHGWRIPESRLFLTALLGGAAGAILGMKLFSHKTKKASFRIGLPFLLVLNIISLYFLIQAIIG
ncbi:DUF1294 domain-containing protein [Gudongella oleilytica]|uniref:DUF1294 domain-containing protein n=1 Tax=Gudongella oleilytica TaxID=1582259 RepID=UPI000FF89937